MVTKRTAPKRAPRRKATKIPPGPRREDYPTVWAWMLAVSESIPEEAWEGIPDDASLNFDHYLDGTPKQY